MTNAAPRPASTAPAAPGNVNPAAFACMKAAMAAGLTTTDRLEIAVAIAGAETGGTWDPTAHCLNCARDGAGRVIREDSRGLWQINVDAHPQYAHWNLYDPAVNAKAMVAVSAGGANWLPWSTYLSGSYRTHLQTARDCINATNLTNAQIIAENIKRINAEVAAGTITRAEGDAEIANVRKENTYNTHPASITDINSTDNGVGVNTLVGAAKDTAHATVSIGHFLALLADGSTWLRVAYVLLGLGLLTLGAFLLDRTLLTQVAGTAVTSAVGGLVGKG